MKNIKLSALQEKEKTVIHVGHVKVGDGFCVIAGPCSVESEKQTIETAGSIGGTSFNYSIIPPLSAVPSLPLSSSPSLPHN
jgi:3-deoxy-D-arabino-heptulosonate 7-phosphate (DAHP) synthase